MRSTEAARQRALLQRKQIAKLERAAIQASRRGVRSVQELRKLQPLLRDLGVAAHLVGNDVALRSRPLKAAEPWAEAIATLAKRSAVVLSDLFDVYGQKATDAISLLAQSAEERLARETGILTMQGATKKEGVSLLGEVFDALGLSTRNSYTLENMFRTQTMLGYGGGRWKAAQEPAIQEILEAYQYVTAGDDRVRDEHEALDGMIAPADHPVWLRCWPPNGYSCRCQAIMMFGEYEEWIPDELTISAAITPGFGYNAGALFT
jgi:SPP1 gp7 family putative phage head morphogenesis protein